jgi:hypothetical protein
MPAEPFPAYLRRKLKEYSDAHPEKVTRGVVVSYQELCDHIERQVDNPMLKMDTGKLVRWLKGHPPVAGVEQTVREALGA